jgi:hypothetical protein
MADLKISALTAATTPLAGTEVLPIVQSSTTKKVSTDDLTVKNIRSNATSGILQVAGPAAASTRVMTTPDANFSAARIDAGQTFFGIQRFTNNTDNDASIDIYGNSTGGDPYMKGYDRNGSTNFEFICDTGSTDRRFDFYGKTRPGTDNAFPLGGAANRWSVVYSATALINTSDEREKQDIAALDDAEKRVAVAVKGLVKKFRFKDSVVEKGDEARIHIGVIAQEVAAAFQAEGLDAMRYGIVCYDEWAELPEIKVAELDQENKETGRMLVQQQYRPAGNRYGVRYEELFAFVIAAM